MYDNQENMRYNAMKPVISVIQIKFLIISIPYLTRQSVVWQTHFFIDHALFRSAKRNMSKRDSQTYGAVVIVGIFTE
jgi:hypothetical protein